MFFLFHVCSSKRKQLLVSLWGRTNPKAEAGTPATRIQHSSPHHDLLELWAPALRRV